MNSSQPMPVEPLPTKRSFKELFFAFQKAGPRWPGALRAALAVTLPGAIALLLGFGNEMLLIAAGGFTVMFGEGHPYRTRWKVMLGAALMLTAGAIGGAFLGDYMWNAIDSGGSHWWLMLSAVYTSTIAVVGTYIQNALRLPPPGAAFIVMVAGGSTMVSQVGLDALYVGFWTLLGAVSGLVIGMFPVLFRPRLPQENAVSTAAATVEDFEKAGKPAVAKNHQAKAAITKAWAVLNDSGAVRGGVLADESQRDLVDSTRRAQSRLAHAVGVMPAADLDDSTDTPAYIDLTRSSIPLGRPSIAYRIYRSAHIHSHATMTALKVAIATLAASTVGIAMGLTRPDWAIVSVLFMIQWGPNKIPGSVRGLHRLIGSLFGIGLFALFHMLQVEGLWLLIALALCQFFAEFFVLRNYAICVIFTTPLALLLGDSLAEPLIDVFVSRNIEMLLSVVFGLVVLWFWFRTADARHHEFLVNRSFETMGSAIGALATSAPHTPLVLKTLRDLQFELLGERYAAQTLAHNAESIAQLRWPTHLEVQRAGYAIVDYGTAKSDPANTYPEVKKLIDMTRAAHHRPLN